MFQYPIAGIKYQSGSDRMTPDVDMPHNLWRYLYAHLLIRIDHSDKNAVEYAVYIDQTRTGKSL